MSDVHAPYHDPKAIDALEAFIEWFKPDDIIFLGDVIDFYALSRFNKDPIRALKLQHEIDIACDVIDIISDAAPDAKKYYLAGNHEKRLQKYLWSKAAELSSLRNLTVENLLGLNERGIEYIDTGRMIYHGLVVKHGDVARKYAGWSAKAEMETEGMPGVSGHTHREAVYERNTTGGRMKWVEAGCLCDLHQEYLEGRTPDWSISFGVGYFWEGSERYDIHTVEIVDDKAMYYGQKF